MKIISVNVGLPREVVWKGISVRTAIFKEPIAGTVAIRELNLAGDQQADVTVHGGSGKAVYAYPVEHYEYWRKQLPDVSFSWGAFGENFTTEGLSEDTLCIGDLLRAGSSILQIRYLRWLGDLEGWTKPRRRGRQRIFDARAKQGSTVGRKKI